MAIRLIKIAKELNVGTSTIVEFLNNNGFDIDNKPTAKVSDEMYNELVKEFQSSIAVKEKADQLAIGNRPITKEEAPPPKKAIFNTPKKVTPPPVKEEIKEVPIEEPKSKKLEERKKPKLKVLGKIDLDAKNKVKKEEEAKPKEEITSKQKETVVEAKSTPKTVIEKDSPKKTKEVPKKKETPEQKQKEVKKSKKAEPAKPAEVKKEISNTPAEELHRAKTPQLKGLKILGKIDADKFKKPKKKKVEKKPAAKSSANKSNTNDSNRPKRKRARKIVTNSPQSRQQGGNTNRGRNQGSNRGRNQGPNRGKNQGSNKGRKEVKEVSKKEIENKIKATMARLSGRGGKKKRQKIRRENRERLRESQEQREMEKQIDTLQLTEFVSVSEFASLMNVDPTDVIMTCMNLGVIVSINQRLDAEIIELVAEEFGHEVEFISAEKEAEEEEEIVDDPEDLKPRAPIVTVMGHVDHGKTSLLDYIRKAKVADGEAGGITQHIGAYEVVVGEEKKKITFLDTPGHEAFTAMRARGAKVTDVAIIIISADDNIMPQTKEAISHAQAANVPMIFAINKIDKDGADPERIKQELASMNLLVEAWGGSYQSQDISAKIGTGIDELLEKVLLEAELLELKANPNRQAVGTVLEASLDKGRGYVTKVLVQNGTLNIKDSLVAGIHSGKIKALSNERGERIKKAGPSTPVLILGLSGAPQAGEKFKVMDSEQEVRQLAARRAQISREQANRANKRISLDEIGRRLALGMFKELNLIVKGDVDGSIEALSDALIKLSVETIQVNVIHKAVGQIIESDVLLASASDAIIIGFQVRPSLGARKLAEREGVEIKTYSIIYEVIDEIKMAMEGMLEPTKEEKVVGLLEVREIFKISRVGTVAGCYVQEGKISRNNHIRLIRNGIVVYPMKEGVTGEIATLKRIKDEVKEVKKGFECGVTIKNFNDIKHGDVIEAYEIIEIKQTL